MADCVCEFLYVYWNEIKACFQGKTRYISPFGSGSGVQQTLSPEEIPADTQPGPGPGLAPAVDAVDSPQVANEMVVSQKKVYVANRVPPQTIRIYLDPTRRLASPQPQTPTRPAFKASSMKRGVISPASPKTPPVAISPPPPPPPLPHPATSPPASTVIYMGPLDGLPTSPPGPAGQSEKMVLTKTPAATKSQHPFRLPKVAADASSSPIKRHESTGSDYFKQMMRGKKPVASISQYAQLKHLKADKDKDKDGRERRDSGRRDKKHAGSKDKKIETEPTKRHHKDKRHRDKKK